MTGKRTSAITEAIADELTDVLDRLVRCPARHRVFRLVARRLRGAFGNDAVDAALNLNGRRDEAHLRRQLAANRELQRQQRRGRA
jgi:hypothetical protein